MMSSGFWGRPETQIARLGLPVTQALRQGFGPAVNLAGVRLNHNQINRAAKARDLSARASVQQAAATVSNLEQLVRLDVRLAVNEAERRGIRLPSPPNPVE